MFTQGGIQLLRSYLGQRWIHQNANVCEQGEGVAMSMRTLYIYNAILYIYIYIHTHTHTHTYINYMQ